MEKPIFQAEVKDAMDMFLKAEALASAFRRVSIKTKHSSDTLTWATIVTGTVTAIVGAVSAGVPTLRPVLSLVASILSALTGALSLIQKQLLPNDKYLTFWKQRNDASSIAEECKLIIRACEARSHTKIQISERIDSTRKGLKMCEDSEDAMVLLDSDQDAARAAVRNNPVFETYLQLVSPSTILSFEQYESEKVETGMTGATRGKKR